MSELKDLESAYAQVTAGREEPDYMEVYTPYGTVVLTPKLITGSKRAIRYAEKLFNARP